MLSPKSIWGIMIRKNKVRRQPGGPRGSGLCGEPCGQVGEEALLIGKTPELCANGTPFQAAANNCIACQVHSGTEQTLVASLPTEYWEYLERNCDEQGNGTNGTGDGDIQDMLSSYSALQESLSSFGVDIETSGTSATNAVTGNATESTSAVSSATGDADADLSVGDGAGNDQDSSPALGVLVPAIVVPVVVCLIAALVLLWAFMRRGKKTREMVSSMEADRKQEIKNQPFHDSFKPELDGTGTAMERPKHDKGFVAELPAREPVGSEMDARERNS